MTADLIIINGTVLTMEPLAAPAEALAILDGRILAVGSNAGVRAHANPRTTIIDAKDRLVLPGVQDTHIHLQDSGYHYGFNAVLDKCRSIAELQDTLATFAHASKSAWVRGVGWYSGIFTDANLGELGYVVTDVSQKPSQTTLDALSHIEGTIRMRVIS